MDLLDNEIWPRIGGTAPEPGEDVLRFLVRQLASALDVRYALVARAGDEHDTNAEAVAVWADNQHRPSFPYPLAGSPCLDVLRDGHCVVLSHVRQRYPEDQLLQELAVESYWGLQLRSSGGDLLGWLAILDSKPILRPGRVGPVLQAFATWTTVELERRGTEAQYQMLFNEMLNGFAVHEILCDEAGRPFDYRFLAVNPAFERLTGWKASDVIGRTVREVMPAVEQEWIDVYGRVALTGEPAHFESYAAILDRHYEVAAYRPRLRQFACLVTDISERKRVEAARARLEQQQQQARSMDSIGCLAGGIAHDLNNLLTPILGYGQMLQAIPSDRDQVEEGLTEIVRAATMARDLVQRLLAFGRKQVLDIKPLDLNALLTDFACLLRRTLREDVVMTILTAPGPLVVRGDRGQIEQVVLNLVVNGQDAMPNGGALRIETSVVHADDDYLALHPGVLAGQYARLTIADSGNGIEPALQARVFEPFFTTKNPGKGTGLGLSTVYGIVKQHEGSVFVESEPGHGTTFTVLLPIHTEAIVSDGVPANIDTKSGAETILLVEDNAPARVMTAGVLRRFGYTVLMAADGDEALALLDGHHPSPVHLLLTDVVMPGMNGRVLFQQAAARRAGLRVLYMSGYTNDVIASHGVLDDGLHFIQKPYSLHALADKVREVLDQPE